jgi:photosystem II stability/assembly factor-like uncharacterized protein
MIVLHSNRKLIRLSLIVWLTILLVGCRKAPETEVSPPPSSRFITSEDLLSVSSPDNSHVWIIGLNATILHSNDGGVHWVSQEIPNKTDLVSISFIDSKNGWAVGKHGTILHTTDGGNNWADESAGVETDKRLISAQFVDSKEGWIVGAYGTILHTESEGAIWEKQGWDEDRIYNDVFFIDSQRGWIVGEYGTILHTEDGGMNWEKQECKDIVPIVDEVEYAPPTKSLYEVYFQNPEKGWAVGLDGVIIATEDGGKNWKRLKSPVDLTLFKVIVMDGKGWAVGLRGSYVSSTNGGESWILNAAALPTKFWLRGLAFSDQNHGWIVGSRGTIIHTTDGGASWEMLSGTSMPQ